jgi:hypothetical protein
MSTTRVQLIDKNTTVGTAAAEDTKIVFDGNAQDYHIGLDDSDDSLTIGLGSALGTTSYMNINADGSITKPLQPAFLVKPSSTQENFNQGQVITIDFGTEVFDNNGDFASNTFTAPVTGRYALQFAIQINDISNQDSSTYYYIEMNTSNRQYYNLSSIDQAVGSSSGQYYFTLSASCLADMDANDTVTCRVVHGGTSGTGPSDISNNSHFSGFLVC